MLQLKLSRIAMNVEYEPLINLGSLNEATKASFLHVAQHEVPTPTNYTFHAPLKSTGTTINPSTFITESVIDPSTYTTIKDKNTLNIGKFSLFLLLK